MRYEYSIIAFLCAALTGCAQFDTAFRTYDNKSHSVMVDVKQRAIISGGQADLPIICAEPSPDAMAAYALEMAASLKTPQQITGQISASGQEGAAYVGLRTQSIQLLRDSLYRLCEGYMNGAISGARFDLLARRYQKNMVALLAIEQLTGTVKAPPVTINTHGFSSVAQDVEQLIQSQKNLLTQKDSITTEINDLDTQINTYDSSIKSTPPPANDELKTINDKKALAIQHRDSLKTSLSSIESALKLINESIRNPTGLATGGLTNAQVFLDSSPARSNQDIQNIATTVGKMVDNIIDGENSEQMCLEFLTARYNTLTQQNNSSRNKNSGTDNRLENFCIYLLEKKMYKLQ